jgi:hypothetical protein
MKTALLKALATCLAAAGHAASWWPLIAMAIGGVVGAYGAYQVPEHYRAQGRKQCQQAVSASTTQTVVKQAAEAASEVASQVAHATSTGTAFERSRTGINAHFNRLATEARHAPSSPADSCVLPADRLRLWESANDGSDHATTDDQGATTGQPGAATSAAATTGIGPDGRPGSQPPGGGAVVPPAGSTALQPPRLFGDRAQ